MNFKLPAIHHLTNQDKKIPSTNPTAYVHVLNGYAIVSYEIIAAVKLNEYIKMECEVEDEEDIEHMYEILDWMEGKSFTKRFWENFTKEQSVVQENDGLLIEDPSYTKFIQYESPVLDLGFTLKSVSDNINKDESAIGRTTIKGSDIDLLHKAFKNELKRDYLNFEFSGVGTPVKFALETRNFIFGSIKTGDHSSKNLLAFIENKDITDNLKDYIALNPPPPPTPDFIDEELEQEEAVEDGGLFN